MTLANQFDFFNTFNENVRLINARWNISLNDAMTFTRMSFCRAALRRVTFGRRTFRKRTERKNTFSMMSFISGLFYKLITMVNYDSSNVNKFGALLADDTRGVIDDCHMFIVQATE